MEDTKTRFMDCLSIIQHEIARTIRCMNNGGCGVFAYLIASRMEEYGLSPRIRVFSRENPAGFGSIEELEEELVNNNNNRLKEWNSHNLNFSHVMVQLDDMIFDSDHTRQVHCYEQDGWLCSKLVKGSIRIETMAELAHDAGWNMMYDRSQNGLVEKIITECFAECFEVEPA